MQRFERKPELKVVETVLNNGTTIFVPDVEVEFYWDEETQSYLEMFDGKGMRQIEAAVEHLFPDYFTV